MSRRDRIHYAICQSRVLQLTSASNDDGSKSSITCSGEIEVSFEDFWKFYERYLKQLLGKDVSPNQRKEVQRKMDAKLASISKTYITKSQVEILQNAAPDEGVHLPSALTLYFDFVEKREQQRISKNLEAKKQLPIFKHREEIVQLVKEHQVTIVAGDTGCGKSTQLPQYLMEAGFTKIACTQPRRIACISLAKRVAYETFNSYGDEVGYQIRFETCKNDKTRILFLTEGVLLRQILGSKEFDMYNVIVLDEVHERHLTTDFLIGILKNLLVNQPSLKLVLMSATINIELFSNYFTDAPVVQVPGRLHPIELRYEPIKSEETAYSRSHEKAKIVSSSSYLEEKFRPEMAADGSGSSGKNRRKSSKHGSDIDVQPFIQVLQMIDRKYPSSERGDCLVFLSGINEIMTLFDAIQLYAAESNKWIVLPLHSSLSIEQQDAVFNIPPEGVRKCVLTTNIAETSVTIDGIRFVIDSGKMKEISYDTTMKMQRLQEFWVSKASAEQRKGRAGRTGPGLCIRLYSEDDFTNFQPYTTPELQRVSLDAVVLQMAAMGVNDPKTFPFLEPPSENAINSAVTLLQEHGALNVDESSSCRVTPVGELLSHLPVDITIGKLMLMASLFHTVDAVLVMAAGLSTLSVFTHKSFRSSDAKDLIKPLLSNHGDPFTLLSVTREWLERKRFDGNEAARKFCRRRGIEEQRLYEINKLKNQFHDILADAKFVDNKEGEKDEKKESSRDEKAREMKDRKRLKDMKKNYDKARKKRKVLSIQDNAFDMKSSDEDEDSALGASIRDLEFQLKNDINSEITPLLTLKDVNMLKVIMSHGLYPNFAIADASNGFKKASEQLFHTKHKKFLSLHPSSSLINFPEYFELRPEEHEPNAALAKSSEHQLIVFSHILATKKPFIVNSFRSPALQTLLLFCRNIETNLTGNVVLFDQWLEVTIEDVDLFLDLVSSAVKLRHSWDELMKLRLSVFKKVSIESELITKPKTKQLEKLLIEKLTTFLHTTIEYTMKTKSSINMDTYTKSPITQLELPPQFHDLLDLPLIESDFVPAESSDTLYKGGFNLTPYLIVGCLDSAGKQTSGSHIQTVWTCEMCDVTMACTSSQRSAHRAECKAKLEAGNQSSKAEDDEKEPSSSSKDAASTGYYCKQCERTLNCSLVEFMRHRKTHESS